MKQESAKTHHFAGVVIALLVAYAVGFIAFTASLATAPGGIENADGIVALTGGGARLDAAVALFERGIGKRLLISGVHPSTTKADLKKLVHGGKRFDCCADLGFTAADTHGNAAEAATWAKAHGFRSLVLVTANYHMPRAHAEFAAEMPHLRIEPYPVDPDGIDLHHWWRDGHAVRLLQAEYAKYLASVVLTTVTSPEARDTLDRHAMRRESKAAS